MPENRSAWRSIIARKRIESNPYALAIDWLDETRAAAQEIVTARERSAKVELPSKVERLGLRWIALEDRVARTEMALFEAARAYAAADSRTV